MLRRAKIVGCTTLVMFVLVLVCQGTRRKNTPRSTVGRQLIQAHYETTETFPNLVFVKPHKIGGTTMGGITRRIASRHGGTTEEYNHRLGKEDFFAKTWNVPKLGKKPGVKMHMWANHLNCMSMFQHTDKRVFQKAFKFTITRDPVDRCLSEFYYDGDSGSREALKKEGIREGMEYHPDPSGDEPATKAKIKYIPKCMEQSVYAYTRCSEDLSMMDVLNTYQLVGITERWVDTIALMKMKLDLNYGDILHLSTKVNDAQPNAAGGKIVAAGIARPPISEEPQVVIDAINARPETKLDKEFWKLANERMDAEIAELTPEGFPEVRAKVERILAELKEYCTDEANNPPYTEKEIAAWHKERDGDAERLFFLDCYWKDHGCGIKCMDKFADEMGLNDDY
ncbi:unnamed protein product [Discosporangium mesarthrocarpum]